MIEMRSARFGKGQEIDPLLRSIIRDQGKWDLDKLEDQIREVLSDEEEE